MIGSGYKTRLFNLHDEYWDRRLGVKTFGYRPEIGSPGHPGWQVHYTPASYDCIFTAMRHAGLNKDDIFTDLGSGMGRAVFAACWMGVPRANGVEILPDLCRAAEANKKRFKLPGHIQFICENATNADLSETTILFMFHPFGADTLRIVLQNLERERAKNLRIVYVNPVFNWVLESTPWLKNGRIIAPSKRWFSKNWNVAIWNT